MYLHIRKKRNKSGSISVVIVDRKNRGYKVIETIGCARNDIELELLISKANNRLKELQPTLFDLCDEIDEKEEILGKKVEFIDIDNDIVFSIGGELIFGKIIGDLGCRDCFKKVRIRKVEKRFGYFKDLVISRILYQGSKLYFINYRKIFRRKKDISVYSVYRLLDKLYFTKLKKEIEKCIFTHTSKIMDNQIFITFYDVTTLYFESESEDDLRRIGFSKDGKIAKPQILLGLYTTLQGYPLSYEIYEGKKYEGHTLIDILQKFQKRFHLKQKPIVVADRGMLTNANIAYLESNGYKYILAYKIKNAKKSFIGQITNLPFITNGAIHTIELKDEMIEYKETIDNKTEKKSIITNQRLILTYSSKRAKRDKQQREKALKELKTKLDNKHITKKDLKLAHNAKYLDIEDNCKIKYKLNPHKIKLQEKLDGIKGFITNDFTLSANDVIAHYQNQYDVEKAFKISKTDLRIRAIYHRLENRIKAHILISFVSYAVYKEFERRLKLKNIKFDFSNKIILDLITNMKAIENANKIQLLKFNKYQKLIYDAIFST